MLQHYLVGTDVSYLYFVTSSRVVIEDASPPGERILAPRHLQAAVENPKPDGMPELVDRAEVIDVEDHLLDKKKMKRFWGFPWFLAMFLSDQS